MNLKKFGGPAILVGIAILLIVVVQAGLGAKYEDGDTLDDGVAQAICCTYLVSILFCLSSIVWFAFALGSKTQKTVFLAQNPNEFQHISVPLASDTQGTAVPSTISDDPAAYVPEKIVIETTDVDTAQMIGFSMIAGSVAMFVLMVLLGFISMLMSAGPGLGFSGGTCNSTCETIWSGAGFSMWASILLFPPGLIALARPWSWFRSAEDTDDSVVKVRAGIVAGIALIAVISFGGPALIVLLIAGMVWLIYYQMEDVELKALKLDEVNELVWTISLPLILVAIIASVFEFGFFFLFGWTSIAGAVLVAILLVFLPLVVCVVVGALIMILSKLNLVGTDGEWGTLDLIKSVFSDISDIFNEEDDAPESEHEFVSESKKAGGKGSQKSTVECVECQATLRFPADYSGKIQCPRCNTSHRV
jgi:hypothetical protein